MGVVELSHDIQQGRGRGRVEVGGRLVGQDKGRLGRHGSGNGHPLLLTAGQLGGPPVFETTQADLGEQLVDTLPPLRFGNALEQQGELGVLPGGQDRDQIIGLKHEADVPEPQPGQPAVG